MLRYRFRLSSGEKGRDDKLGKGEQRLSPLECQCQCTDTDPLGQLHQL